MTRKRNYLRVTCRVKAALEHNGRMYHGHLENLSLNGALLRLDQTIHARPGDACRLSVYPHEEKAPLRFRAEMVHIGFSLAGMSFLPMDEQGVNSLVALLQAFMPDVQNPLTAQILQRDEG